MPRDERINLERALHFFSESIRWDANQYGERGDDCTRFALGDRLVGVTDFTRALGILRATWPQQYNVLYLYYGYADESTGLRGLKSIEAIARRLRTHHQKVGMDLQAGIDHLTALLCA